MKLSFRSLSRRTGLTSTRRFRPVLDGLEDRTVLSVAVPAPGEAGPVVITGTDGNDQIVIRMAPTMGPMAVVEFSDDGGATFARARLLDVTAIRLDGLGGDDRITFDYANGFIGKSEEQGGLPIFYDGGVGSDALVLANRPGNVVSAETTGPVRGEGVIQLSDGTNQSTIRYSSVESVGDAKPPVPVPDPENDGSTSGDAGQVRRRRRRNRDDRPPARQGARHLDQPRQGTAGGDASP